MDINTLKSILSGCICFATECKICKNILQVEECPREWVSSATKADIIENIILCIKNEDIKDITTCELMNIFDKL